MGHFGFINPETLGISFPTFSQSHMQSMYTKYGNGTTIDLSGHDINTIPHEDLNTILTDHHEFDHFNQLVSSSYGVLLFRIYAALNCDVIYLGKVFFDHGLCISNGRKKMIDWLEEIGLDLLETKSQPPVSKGELYLIRKSILPGMQNLKKLLLILNSQGVPSSLIGLTAGQFCDLLNECNDYLRMRTDVDFDWDTGEPKGPKWVTYLNPDSIFIKENEFFASLSNILEILAYLGEHNFLLKNHANETTMAWWEEKRIPKFYLSVINNLRRLYSQEHSLLRGYFAAYLDAPIDIACGFTRVFRHVLEEQWAFFLPAQPNSANVHAFTRAAENRFHTSIMGFATLQKKGQLFGPKSQWRQEDDSFLNYNKMLLKAEHSFLEAINRKLQIKYDLQNGKTSSLQLADLIMLVEYRDNFNIYDARAKAKERFDFFDIIAAVYYPLLPAISLRLLDGFMIPITDYKAAKLKSSLTENFAGYLTEKQLAEFHDWVDTYLSKNHLTDVFSGIEILWYDPN